MNPIHFVLRMVKATIYPLARYIYIYKCIWESAAARAFFSFCRGTGPDFWRSQSTRFGMTGSSHLELARMIANDRCLYPIKISVYISLYYSNPADLDNFVPDQKVNYHDLGRTFLIFSGCHALPFVAF